MKKAFILLGILAMLLTFTTSVSADGGERGIAPSGGIIVKPMDGGERG